MDVYGRRPHIHDIRHWGRRSMELSMNKRFGLAIVMLFLAIPSASASELLEVSVGHSQVIGPIADMSTVIVGDDGVADATLGGGGTIILTGRSLGVTNLIVLDEAGRELLASALHVVPQDRRPTTNIRVVKGFSAAQEYVCPAEAGCAPVKSAAPPMVADIDTADETEPPAAPGTPKAPAIPETEAPVAEERLTLNP